MWNFEETAFARTPCQIHTFDCTTLPNGTDYTVPEAIRSRVTLHKLCVGTKKEAKTLEHFATWYMKTSIEKSTLDFDVICRDQIAAIAMGGSKDGTAGGKKLVPIVHTKMDIEGFEWSVMKQLVLKSTCFQSTASHKFDP